MATYLFSDRDLGKAAVKDHKEDIKDFEKESKKGKDPDVKAFAAKTLPTLRKHLQNAEALAKKQGACRCWHTPSKLAVRNQKFGGVDTWTSAFD